MVAQTSLSIAYGIDVASTDDPIIALTNEALKGVYIAQTKGRIFNLLPFRKPNLLRIQWATLNFSGQSFTFRGGSPVLALKRMPPRTSLG